MVYQQTRRCSVCGEPITIAQALHGGGHCGSLPCMTQITVTNRTERRRQRREEWETQARITREQTGRRLASVVPHQNNPLVVPSADRVRDFEQRLDEAIAEAFADETLEPDMPVEEAERAVVDPLTALVSAACGACQGACCFQGNKNQAFVSPRLIARMRAQMPEAGPDEIRALYTDARPERATENACLFQGEQGCTLPRSHRSVVCNSFQCWHLKTALKLGEFHPGQEIAMGAFDGTLQKVTMGIAPVESTYDPKAPLDERDHSLDFLDLLSRQGQEP